ncbi:MAG: ABC transporter substrate-binding protein [Spirochaetota bacterium]
MRYRSTRHSGALLVHLILALPLAFVAFLGLGCSVGGISPAHDDPVTFTAFFADPNPTWNDGNDDIGRYIAETRGVTLDVETAAGDPEVTIRLLAISGDYPDFISPKGTTGELIAAGALLDLTDLIGEHAPNIEAMLGDEINRLRYSESDPSIYFIPTLDKVDQYYYTVGGPFNLQLDAVRELGYPDIRTLGDYEAAIRGYIERHPTINGQETIGLSLLAEDWRILISTTNPAFYATGAPDDGEYYIDPETYEATLHYKRPAEREYFRWLNHMNDAGLLDPESFVQSYDQYLTKIASGRVLAVIDQDWAISPAVNKLKADGLFERTYGRFPVTLDETYEIPVFQQTGYIGSWGTGITTSCEDPVRAIRFLDWLASEEGQILVNWGIEGVHYEYDDHGRRAFLPEIAALRTRDENEFRRRTGIGNYNISLRYGDGNKDSTGNYFTLQNPEQLLEKYSDLEKEVLAAYGATYWKDLFPGEDEFPVKAWGAAWTISYPNDSPLTTFYQRQQEIIRRRIPEAILVSPEEFDRVYDTMLMELDAAGAPEMEALFTEYVRERVELWNR